MATSVENKYTCLSPYVYFLNVGCIMASPLLLLQDLLSAIRTKTCTWRTSRIYWGGRPGHISPHISCPIRVDMLRRLLFASPVSNPWSSPAGHSLHKLWKEKLIFSNALPQKKFIMPRKLQDSSSYLFWIYKFHIWTFLSSTTKAGIFAPCISIFSWQSINSKFYNANFTAG